MGDTFWDEFVAAASDDTDARRYHVAKVEAERAVDREVSAFIEGATSKEEAQDRIAVASGTIGDIVVASSQRNDLNERATDRLKEDVGHYLDIHVASLFDKPVEKVATSFDFDLAVEETLDVVGRLVNAADSEESQMVKDIVRRIKRDVDELSSFLQ